VNTDEIQQCIPHRDPFLWIDEITEISDNHIVAKKFLADSLPVFQGHYPSFPVFPGVLQCEACFQAGAVLISRQVPTGSNEVPVVTRLNNVQFRRMIRPGETIQIDVELTERLQNAFYLKGKVTVDGKVTCRLEFVCTAAAL
jgi:3-hydroxyacyl-[acyl-carrier-protein] dehydratase